MRVAVVGCGGMGQVHALNYAKMPGVELVGVCDTIPELAEAAARKAGTSAYYSFEEMAAAAQF